MCWLPSMAWLRKRTQLFLILKEVSRDKGILGVLESSSNRTSKTKGFLFPRHGQSYLRGTLLGNREGGGD